jgi:hypothetical protein
MNSNNTIFKNNKGNDKNNNKNNKSNNYQKNFKKNKRIKYLKLYDKYGYLQNNKYSPFYLRDVKNFPRAYKIAKEFQRQAEIEYMFSLLYPDRAYKSGRSVKLPSTLPIPTTTFGWYQQTILTTNDTGYLNLFWAPNFYITNSDAKPIHDMAQEQHQDINYSDFNYATCASLYYNNHTTLNGKETNNHFRPILQEFHELPVSKYRLVSSLLRITYTGKSINKSGYATACATYHDTSRIIVAGFNENVVNGVESIASIVNQSIQDFSNNSLIAKGQWARTFNSRRLKDGIEFLYLPTDCLNTVFSNSGSVGNKSCFKYTNLDSISHDLSTDGSKRSILRFTPDNTNLQYAVGLAGVTPNEPLLIEEYRLFETIPTEKNMSMFRQSNNSILPSLDNVPLSQSVILNESNSIRTNTSTIPETSLKKSIFKSFIDKAKNIVNKPIVKKIIKESIPLITSSLLSNTV